MTIEPIGSIDSNTTPLIELLQVFQVHSRERHPVVHEPDTSYLTAGDREFLTTVYGPRVLALGDSGAKRFGTPQFLLDVVADRKSGRLPIGTELTATYVQARFDAHVDLNETVSNPLTEQNLRDAWAFFHERTQGGAIDVQA